MFSHLLNIEPNDDEVSSWCKLHGDEFKGKMIPFGALVYFKPSDAHAREQQHKFDQWVFLEYLLDIHWGWDYTGQGSIVFGLYVIGPNKT